MSQPIPIVESPSPSPFNDASLSSIGIPYDFGGTLLANTSTIAVVKRIVGTRKKFVIANTGSETIFLRFGSNAVYGRGIPLLAGAALVLDGDDSIWNGDVSLIAGATATYAGTEFIK